VLVHLNCRVKLLNCIIGAPELLEISLACTSLVCAPELSKVAVLNFSSQCNWTVLSRVPRSSFLNCLVSALELFEVPPTCTSLVSTPELLGVTFLNCQRYCNRSHATSWSRARLYFLVSVAKLPDILCLYSIIKALELSSFFLLIFLDSNFTLLDAQFFAIFVSMKYNFFWVNCRGSTGWTFCELKLYCLAFHATRCSNK
jgi:hypothetical protein